MRDDIHPRAALQTGHSYVFFGGLITFAVVLLALLLGVL
jgi:hypothetical protein